MTPEQADLKQFLIKAAAPIDGTFDGDSVLVPMWIVDSGKIDIIATPWQDDHEKRAAVTFVKAKMRELGAKRYVQIAEVWTLVTPKDKGIPESIRLGGRIANHPDRREAVIAIAEDKQGNCIKMTRYILRPEHEKATLSEPEFDFYQSKATDGLMTHLLQD